MPGTPGKILLTVMVKEKNKNLKYFFDVMLPDENREVTIEIEAIDENQAWDKLPLELEKKYEGKRWFYTGRFIKKNQ